MFKKSGGCQLGAQKFLKGYDNCSQIFERLSYKHLFSHYSKYIPRTKPRTLRSWFPKKVQSTVR